MLLVCSPMNYPEGPKRDRGWRRFLIESMRRLADLVGLFESLESLESPLYGLDSYPIASTLSVAQTVWYFVYLIIERIVDYRNRGFSIV